MLLYDDEVEEKVYSVGYCNVEMKYWGRGLISGSCMNTSCPFKYRGKGVNWVFEVKLLYNNENTKLA